jgi:hypothetical protein
MATPTHTYDREKLRLTKSTDYWWDTIMGGLLTTLILIGVGGLVFMKLNLTYWVYPYFIFCIFIVAFYQWLDDNLTVIQTGLSKADNITLVTTSLDNLNWNYEKTTTTVDMTLNKYLLKFISPTIILESERVLINFQYHSTSKTGRLPFFFGISTYLEWTFKRTLNKVLLTTNRSDQVRTIEKGEVKNANA